MRVHWWGNWSFVIYVVSMYMCVRMDAQKVKKNTVKIERRYSFLDRFDCFLLRNGNF